VPTQNTAAIVKSADFFIFGSASLVPGNRMPSARQGPVDIQCIGDFAGGFSWRTGAICNQMAPVRGGIRSGQERAWCIFFLAAGEARSRRDLQHRLPGASLGLGRQIGNALHAAPIGAEPHR
jgi:hypothetical protein